jgi:hypothetical protein
MVSVTPTDTRVCESTNRGRPPNIGNAIASAKIIFWVRLILTSLILRTGKRPESGRRRIEQRYIDTPDPVKKNDIEENRGKI